MICKVRSVAMCTFPRESRDFAGVAVLFASRYIYTYTRMYITHVYLHVYTYVYHVCIFTCIHICISHMYIYIHKHMHITHLAALSLSCSFHCPAALPAPKTPTILLRVAQQSAASLLRSFECRAAFSRRRGMYRHIQGDMNWLSLVCTCTWKGVCGLRRRGWE